MRSPAALALSLATLATVPAFGCGGARDHDESSAGEAAIVDGFPVDDARADAVGTLGFVYGPRTFDAKCTATLIAPNRILTAKHCTRASVGEAPYYLDREVGFAIGKDAGHPRRVVRVIGGAAARLDEGGFVGFGHDVAVLKLAEPVTDVAPVPVAPVALREGEVGRRLFTAGYGAQDWLGQTRGTRRAGVVRLVATRGRAMPAVYGSREAFFSALVASEGAAWVDAQRADLDAFFDRELLAEGEVYVVADHAQPCDGDSGGPLVRRLADGTFEIVGVVSGSKKGAGGRCSVLGELYAPVDAALAGQLSE